MQIKDTTNQQPTVSTLGPENGTATADNPSIGSSGSSLLETPANLFSRQEFSALPWLNAPMRRVAEKRLLHAERENLPYVMARQQVGDDLVVLDGGVAQSLSSWTDLKTKLFGSSGVCWDGNREKTDYLIYLPGAKNPVAVGTEKDLLERQLSIGDISLLLSVNDCDDEQTEEENEYLPQSRAAYHLLLSLGHIFERDLAIATKIIEPLGKKFSTDVIVDMMVTSAGSAWPTLLEAGILQGYDPTKRSKFSGRTPIEQAQKNFREKSLILLSKYNVK
jgi:hypothetical protein